MSTPTNTPDQSLIEAKLAHATALAAYSSLSGRATTKAVNGWMRSDLSSLVRMCHERGLFPAADSGR